MGITSEQIANLKELAETVLNYPPSTGSMKGPWIVHKPENTMGWGYCVGPEGECLIQLRGRYAKKQKITNAAYLAAVSPDTILALIAEIERLRELTR